MPSRPAAFCGPLECPLVVSEAMARLVAPGTVAEIERYDLKGLPGAGPIFAPLD